VAISGGGGDAGVVAAHAGGGGGGTRSGFRGKMKGGRMNGRSRQSARGGGGAGWAGRGRKGHGPRLGQKSEMGQSSRNNVLSNFIRNLDFWQTLEICTWRFRRNFDMGILPKIF
jgi:hypothetical protein